MAEEKTSEQKAKIAAGLETFLKKTELCVNRPNRGENLDQSPCSMVLYHLVHIVAALATGDEEIANQLKTWLGEHGEKLRVCNREEYFENNMAKINASLNRILDPTIETGPGSGTQLDSYLDFINQINLC